MLGNLKLSVGVILLLLTSFAWSQEPSTGSASAPYADVLSTLPSDPGAYFREGSAWRALRKAPQPHAIAKVTGLTVMGGGSGRAMVFDGAHATIAIQDKRPLFAVNETGWDDRQVKLVRLDVKKNTREVVFKGGENSVRGKSLVDITVTSVKTGDSPLFTVVPAEDLDPGEYLLSWNSAGVVGFEFTVPERSSK